MAAVRTAFPEASLPDLDGTARPVSDAWAAGPALIVIGHTECGTTRLTLPYLDRLDRQRAPGAAVRAILQDDPASARAFADELGLRLPVLLEPDPYALSAALGLGTVPTIFLVEPDGAIAERSEGFRRDALERLAQRLGVATLFTAADAAPPLRPG